MTQPEQPRTEAGRAWLGHSCDDGVEDQREHILAIEAEAALTDERVEAFERDFGVPHPSRRAALPVPAIASVPPDSPLDVAKARYNESWGLPPNGCNCHHGSARWCPIHTQADFDAAEAALPVPALDAINRFLRRAGGLVVRSEAGRKYVRVPSEWIDDLAALREGETP